MRVLNISLTTGPWKSITMWNKVLFILLCLINTKAVAQRVDNQAYELMLSSMLSHEVNEITVDEAKAMKRAVYVDSRALNEFNVSHLRDAIWIGYEDPKLVKLNDIDKSRPLIIYCSVGYRSEKIVEKLQKEGFESVYNLYGGIFEWVNQGNDVVDPEGKITQKVHAYNRLWGIWLQSGDKVY